MPNVRYLEYDWDLLKQVVASHAFLNSDPSDQTSEKLCAIYRLLSGEETPGPSPSERSLFGLPAL